MNKVVARFADGRIVKGSTSDFGPGKPSFHVAASDAPAKTKPLSVELKELKALFFVKNFDGSPTHNERKEFDPNRPVAGRKIKVIFKDEEILVGVTNGYQPGRPGFFMVPADQESNIERCFVVSAAAREITLL
jgi:hypothetical protein